MKAFAFDLDNTLYDRYATIEKIIASHYDRVEKYINVGYSMTRAIEHVCHSESLFICDGWEAVYHKLIEENFFNSENIPDYEKVRSFMAAGFNEFAVPHPYANSVLKSIKDKGYKLAILTNAADYNYQKKKLEMLGHFDNLFDVVVISGEYSEQMSGDRENKLYQKPNPSIFEHTAALLHVNTKDMYYVGDNPKNDVVGAMNSGCTPVWIRSKSPWVLDNSLMPKYSFDTIEGLLSLI